MGKLKVNYLEGDILCYWLEVHVRLYLVGFKLEIGAKIRATRSYLSNNGHLGLTAADAVVWLL